MRPGMKAGILPETLRSDNQILNMLQLLLLMLMLMFIYVSLMFH